MDNDAQFLLGSASGAMEERERLRAKHERLKHEAAAWRSMQLKEAAELAEKLEELDEETKHLEAQLHALDEQATRLSYQAMREGFKDSEARQLRYGYLRGQVAGWAAEFERVTQITGVRFGEGKSDAVDKVVSIYSQNELRNKSQFKYVTEELVGKIETLQAELAAEENEAKVIEAEQAAHEEGDASASARSIEASETQMHLASQLERACSHVENVLPLVEKLGIEAMHAANQAMPQHLDGKALAPPTVPAFLELLEDALDAVMNRALHVVSERKPPEPVTEEEVRAAEEAPPEVVTPTLALLRAATAQRTLPAGAAATKLLHNDSSERLLQMG